MTDATNAAEDWASATGRAAARARASGALAPIDTRLETLTAQGLIYAVRVLSNVRRKQQAVHGSPADPFAPPYEPALWVGDLAPAHVALLNKFPVLDRHLLAVTREPEPQTSLLTAADCEAMLWLLHDWDGLVFYNGGPEAGASQPHKHLQIVDLPLPPGAAELPVTRVFAADEDGDAVGSSPALPFPHARVRMPEVVLRRPAEAARLVRVLYLELLEAIGLGATGLEQAGPYNLLATREWLWLVPRRQSHCQGIEVNALGFAGALLVPDDTHLSTLKAIGPAECLRAVCP